MFNRAKLISLIAASATVMTIIPANAATSIETKEGRFDNAVAYNGKYIYKGYKNDDRDSLYISDNSNNNTRIDRADDYSDYNVKYDKKYVIAKESDSENYLVDLSSGRINTNETIEEKQSYTANSLKNTLKSTDRYGRNVSIDRDDLKRIDQNQFGDVWYRYKVQPGSDAENHDNVTDDGKFVGFVNNNGDYIDASHIANLPVLSNGHIIKIDEFGRSRNNVTAKLKSMDVIAQDKNNIYVLTEVDVSGGDTSSEEAHQTFVQKISKEKSSDKKDGANIPKTVESYMLTDVFRGNDDNKAADLITLSSLSNTDYCYSVKDGVLYLTQKTSSDEIKVTKFSMKRDRIALDGSSDRLDAYLVRVENDRTHDIASGSSVSIDDKGNIWGINRGKIFKFDGLSAADVYTCDTSINRIDVYDEKNLVAWSTSSDVYVAVVNGRGAGSSQNNNDNNNSNGSNNNNNNNNNSNTNSGTNNNNNNNGTSNLVPSGWVKEGDNWYFRYSDGSNKTGWYYELGNWYYFYGNGQMATAFIDLNGAVYYLNPYSDGNQGAMRIGWQQINGYWYYFNPVSDSFGYQGMMQRGWRYIGGAWYFFYYDGTMASNTRIGGYYVNSSGAWVPGV